MASMTVEHRQLASLVGGTKSADGRIVARRHYRLGTAPAPDGERYIVTMIGKLDDVAMTFEAQSFEHAFRRALEIAEDIADVAGHLQDGVVVSVEEFESISEIGLDQD